MDFALTDRGLEFNFQRRESGADAAEASSTSTNGATATTPGVGSTASDVPNVQQQSLLSLLGAAVSPNASTASLNPSKAASTSVNPLLALLQAGSSSTTAPVPAFVLDARAVEQQQKQLKAVETRKEEQPRPAVEHFKAVEKQQQQRPRQQPAIPRVSTLNVDAMINSDALPVPHLLRSSTVALMTRPERYQRGRLADVTSRLIAYSKDRNVRLIQQSDGVFVLLKRHQAPIVDMAFAPVVIKSGAPTSAPSYLCTIGEDALLVVWEIDQLHDDCDVEEMTRVCFQLTADHAILRNCTWHPTQALLAFSAGSLVYVVDVPTAIKTIGTSDVSLTLSELAALPSGCTVLSCPGQAAVHALAFDNRNGLVAGLANGRVCQFTLSGIVDRVESRPIVGRLQSTFDTNATGVTSVSTVIPVSPGTIIVGTNQNTTLSLWTSTETGSHQCIHTLHLQWTPAVHDIKNYATCVFDELSHNVFVWPGGKIEGVVLHVEGASSEAPQWTVRGTVAQEERVASPTLSTVVVRNEVVTSAFSVLTKAIIRVELPPMHAHLDVEWPIIEGGGATTTDAVTSPTTAATLVKLATGVSPSKSESSTKNAHPLTATAKASPKQAPVSPRGGVVQPSPVKKPVMDALAATVAPVVNNISSRVSSPVSPALGVESAPAVTAIREIECNKDASGETSLVKPKPRTEEAVASQTAPNAALAPSLTAAEITTAVEIAVKKEIASLQQRDTALKAALAAQLQTTLSAQLPDLVQAAVAKQMTSMQHALTTTVSDRVESAINKAIPTTLKKTLSEAFSSNATIQQSIQTAVQGSISTIVQYEFKKTLIPSYDSATKAMFQQIHDAFQSGLGDVFKSVPSTLGEWQSTAASLTATLHKRDDQFATALAAMQAAQMDQFSKLNEMLKSMASDLAAAKASSGVPAAVPTTPFSAPTSPLDLRAQIAQNLQRGEFETAFLTALHSGDLALLQYAMSAVPVKSVFVNGAPSPLSQPVLLALVQQASCALDTDAALKFDWMQECLMSIDPRHPTIADHLRKVLGPFLDRMRDFALQNTDRALTKQAAILTHVANSLLAMQ